MLNPSVKRYFTRCFPNVVQHFAERVYGVLPYEIKFGRVYSQMRNTLRQSETWSLQQIQNYQLLQLRRLIEHAVATVPYYQKLLKSGDIDPKAILSVADIKLLPVISKEQMRANPRDYISSTYRVKYLHEATTGGSSGEPFRFYSLSGDRKIEWAFIHHIWSRIGFSPLDWRVVLRGEKVDTSMHWKEVPKTRELVLSAYHLDAKTMRDFYEVVKHRGYRFLHCHPSSGFLFAQFLCENNLTLPMQAILAASEMLHPFQRDLMQKAFKCRIFSFYGLSERVCMAGECEHNIQLHPEPLFGITEVTDEAGNDVAEEGGEGEILATGFIGKAMPFIRYRTEDRAIVSNKPCDCGRKQMRLKSILGREHEYVVTRNDKLISLTGLIYGQHFKAFERIRKMQVIQERPGEIDLLIVKTADFAESDECEIRHGIAECVQSGLEVHFRFVDHISVTERGKHTLMIQRLQIDHLRSSSSALA